MTSNVELTSTLQKRQARKESSKLPPKSSHASKKTKRQELQNRASRLLVLLSKMAEERFADMKFKREFMSEQITLFFFFNA